MVDALPQSLDAEFGRRFDEHQQRMPTLLAQWLSARLSLHAREHAIALTDATVTISRAKMRFFARAMGMRAGDSVKYSDSYGTVPSQGFLVAIAGVNGLHRCLFRREPARSTCCRPASRSNRGCAVSTSWCSMTPRRGQPWPGGRSDDRLGSPCRKWPPARMRPSEMVGRHVPRRDRAGREAAGQTPSEETVDALLDLIPFRAMIVALRKGTCPRPSCKAAWTCFLLPLVVPVCA